MDNNGNININWFPGHMKKTIDLLKKNLNLVDIVFEILDSRIPISSKNPEIDNIVLNKPRIIVMNKCDLSNEIANKKWKEYYIKKNIKVVFLNATKNHDKGIENLIRLTNDITKGKRRILEKKGIKNKPIRAMIVGIPNVGKSTLINSLVNKKSAKVGNKPGITKGNQWIKTKGNFELLDTPGVLWPKFQDEKIGLNLAFTGAIKDEIIDIETLSLKLIERLVEISPKLLIERYGIEICKSNALSILESIAIKRGCILKGKEIDYKRISKIILDEFRKGKIGRITLELPDFSD